MLAALHSGHEVTGTCYATRAMYNSEGRAVVKLYERSVVVRPKRTRGKRTVERHGESAPSMAFEELLTSCKQPR